jgi:hypothetical protein
VPGLLGSSSSFKPELVVLGSSGPTSKTGLMVLGGEKNCRKNQFSSSWGSEELSQEPVLQFSLSYDPLGQFWFLGCKYSRILH